MPDSRLKRGCIARRLMRHLEIVSGNQNASYATGSGEKGPAPPCRQNLLKSSPVPAKAHSRCDDPRTTSSPGRLAAFARVCRTSPRSAILCIQCRHFLTPHKGGPIVSRSTSVPTDQQTKRNNQNRIVRHHRTDHTQQPQEGSAWAE